MLKIALVFIITVVALFLIAISAGYIVAHFVVKSAKEFPHPQKCFDCHKTPCPPGCYEEAEDA